MKHLFLSRLTVVFMGLCILLLGFFACKKNLVKPQCPDDVAESTINEDDACRIVRKIKQFETQLKRCKTEKVDCNMQIDSVLWNVEALINSRYTFPEKDYSEMVTQNLHFSVDVDDGCCMSMNDVAAFYDDVYSSVRNAYANDGISSDKSLKIVVINKCETIGDKVDVEVNVISGSGIDNQGGGLFDDVPFDIDDCWYFGELGGTCDDPSVPCDAAEILEYWLNKLYAYTSVPQEGYRYINHNLVTVSLCGSEYFNENGMSYIFNTDYSDDQDLYFDYDRLVHYFNGEKKVILELLPENLEKEYDTFKNMAFFQVDIRGLYQDGVAYHDNRVTYGNRMLVPETDIGPAVDMLK